MQDVTVSVGFQLSLNKIKLDGFSHQFLEVLCQLSGVGFKCTLPYIRHKVVLLHYAISNQQLALSHT